MEGISGCIGLVILTAAIVAVWVWLTRRRAKGERQDTAYGPTGAHVNEEEQQPRGDQLQPYGQEPRNDPNEEQRQKRREQ